MSQSLQIIIGTIFKTPATQNFKTKAFDRTLFAQSTTLKAHEFCKYTNRVNIMQISECGLVIRNVLYVKLR